MKEGNVEGKRRRFSEGEGLWRHGGNETTDRREDRGEQMEGGGREKKVLEKNGGLRGSTVKARLNLAICNPSLSIFPPIKTFLQHSFMIL